MGGHVPSTSAPDHDKDKFLQGELLRFLSDFTGEITEDDVLHVLFGEEGATSIYLIGEFSSDLVNRTGDEGATS